MVMTGIAWPGRLLKSFETLPVSTQGFPDNEESITRTDAAVKQALMVLCSIAWLYTVFPCLFSVTLLLLLFSALYKQHLFHACTSQKRDPSFVALPEVSPIFIVTEVFYVIEAFLHLNWGSKPTVSLALCPLKPILNNKIKPCNIYWAARSQTVNSVSEQ